jgi:hypothetical protein
MALGMVSSSGGVSATSSPRLPQTSGGAANGAPSAFRSPPINPPMGFEGSSMYPMRAAPAPPTGSTSRRDSGSYADSRFAGGYTQSNQNSPNPNRYSSGPSGFQPMTNGTATGVLPPQRPTRAGTLPLYENGNTPTSAFQQNPMSPSIQSARSPPLAVTPNSNTHSAFLTQNPPPPLVHQPFSAPGNPYSATGLEKTFEDAKIGLGMPMGISDLKEKELPKEPEWDREELER